MSAPGRGHVSAFPRKRLVKICTKRFRVIDVAASAIAIWTDALSAAIEDVHPKGADV